MIVRGFVGGTDRSAGYSCRRSSDQECWHVGQIKLALECDRKVTHVCAARHAGQAWSTIATVSAGGAGESCGIISPLEANRSQYARPFLKPPVTINGRVASMR